MSHRSTRVAEAIKVEVGALLLHRLKDSRVPSERVSVTNVEVSGDLRHATIFVSVLGDEDQQKQALEGLRSAAGFIRSALGKAIQLRSTPEVHFKLDHSIEHGAHILALLNRLSQEREQSGQREGQDAS
ncbi:MAG: 30S ribosome-binding factor RbfA [Candidatus Sericytochromatia bacterium]|nr:30S ribosome-binding factor RbfA [Candidatus Sericytochromatia bacterium]